MLDTLNALLDQPLLLGLVLLAGALCGIAVERLVEGQKRAERRAYWQGRNQRAKGTWRRAPKVVPLKGTPERAVHDAAEQLRCVMEAQFTARPLLNKPERRLLAIIDEALAQDSPGWRAMAQVNLGEILASPETDAYLAVNSKRVDLLIIDRECRPLHAIEFQGSGHHLNRNAAARDAVKKEALRRAGIGYHEVKEGDTPAEVRATMGKLIRLSLPAQDQSTLRMSSASCATGIPNLRTVNRL